MWPPKKAELVQLFKDGAELQTIAEIYNAERSLVYDIAQYYGIEMMTPTQRKQARARMESEGRSFPTPHTLEEFQEEAHLSQSTRGQIAYSERLYESERQAQVKKAMQRQKERQEYAQVREFEKRKKRARVQLKKEKQLQEAFARGRHKRRFSIEEATREIEKHEVEFWVREGYDGDRIVYETGIERHRLVKAFRKYGFETAEAFPRTEPLAMFEVKKYENSLVAYDIEGIRKKAAEGYALWRIAHHFGYLEKKVAQVVEDFAIQVNSIEDDPFRHEVRAFFKDGTKLFSEGCHHFRIGSRRMHQLMKAYRVMTTRATKRKFSKERPPKKLLEDLYNNQKLTRVQIGRQLNVSVNDLTEWFDEYGMKSFKRKRNEPKREELYDMYINQRWSKNAIGRHYNRSLSWVDARLDAYGIERVRYTRKNPPPRHMLYDLYIKQGFTQPVVAEILHVSVPLLSWFLKDYGISRRQPK